jgi:Fe-S-cluster containining protein
MSAPLDAGRFSAWLGLIQEVIRNGDTSDVPCGSCTACCTSSQFIHIAPGEVDTLAKIPGELLFPAPRLPVGHVLMGYDENGHCPMLVDGACSIYERRPRTCRTYDCRVFAASGLELEDPAKSAISDQVSRWQFQQPERIDQVELEAVRSAALRLGELEPGFNATERTLATIEIHDQFLAMDPDQEGCAAVTPDPEPVTS